MITITLPKKVGPGKELVAIPREEYEEYLQWQKIAKPPRVFKTFKPTIAELWDLKRARKNRRRGNYLTIDELKRKLGFTG